jgi:hypothetical protein
MFPRKKPEDKIFALADALGVEIESTDAQSGGKVYRHKGTTGWYSYGTIYDSLICRVSSQTNKLKSIKELL